MAGRGKSLRFDDAEIEELCELSYGRPRTFATLAMLYPGLDLTKQFSVQVPGEESNLHTRLQRPVSCR